VRDAYWWQRSALNAPFAHADNLKADSKTQGDGHDVLRLLAEHVALEFQCAARFCASAVRGTSSPARWCT